MKKLFIGVEIGATKIQIALGDADGNLLFTKQGKVVLSDGARGILEWMKSHIPEVVKKGAEFGGQAAAIGVGFGGFIESSTGTSLISVQVEGWKDFAIKAWFEDAFKLPTVVLNDTVAGGYAEYISGSGKDSRNFFYSNIGSGIGGAFIIDGVCYDGIGYGAAYLGHTYIPDWTSDVPGAFTKVENICSGFAIEKRLSIKCATLAEMAKNGDDFALAEIDKVAKTYAIGLANVITLLGPDRVSINGGVAKMGELLLGPIRRHVEELVLILSKDRYTIVASKHQDAAVLIGSILFAAKEAG